MRSSRPPQANGVAAVSRRWWFVGMALVAALFVAISAFSQDRPRLIVYLQTQVKSRALEALLARQMPDVDVVVCARYRDFTHELGRTPDAALALTPVLSSHRLALDLKGRRGDQETETYVLLSIGAPIDKARYASIVVGAVDLLGREKTADFVAVLLGVESTQEIKYVIKSEDLLPLLQFQSADAVLLAEQDALRLKSLSKLDLRVTPLATRVGLPAVAFRSDVGRKVIGPLILALDAETNGKLGVDAWR
jgi:hypothetical protein